MLWTSQAAQAKQVGLHADQVPVAAAEVQDRLDAGLAADPLARDQRRDPRTRPGTVRHVHRIDAVLAERLASLDGGRKVAAARRQQLDGRDPLPLGEPLAQFGLLGQGGGLSGLVGFFGRGDRRPDGRAADGLDGADDFADVLGPDPATTADGGRAQVDVPPGVGRHVLGRTEIESSDRRLPWACRRWA